ncbi:hypothetical protein IAE22_30365, partial [Bacillus sp. S34]|nr:hypothetical protein [Bacillus sp. S34]
MTITSDRGTSTSGRNAFGEPVDLHLPGGTAPHSTSTLSVRGARVHNLRDVDLEIPRDSLVVFTGLSGSGKSSLAFDTIFAEG